MFEYIAVQSWLFYIFLDKLMNYHYMAEKDLLRLSKINHLEAP